MEMRTSKRAGRDSKQTHKTGSPDMRIGRRAHGTPKQPYFSEIRKLPLGLDPRDPGLWGLKQEAVPQVEKGPIADLAATPKEW